MSAPQQRYRVIERIAAGGMAEVFRAESAGLEGFKKKVAIKRVLPHLAGKTEFIGMFLDEARLSAHLGHSNCVQVFDIGQGDNTYFIVMEMVDGADLKGVMTHTRNVGRLIPVEEAVLICVRICEGLAYAHELHDDKGQPLRIVHRDMSPPNVLMTRYGEVKIADFGLAKANSQLEDSQPGIIKGKFGYLSPEAAKGQSVDARTDIFAVGIILWEMLAGRRLFQGKSDLETVKQVQRAQVPDVRQFNPSVPESVVQVLRRTLAGEPSQRYQTARALGDDLNQVLFRLPRAVSSFDIAQLVLPVQAAREAEKAQKTAQGSLIGSLIDQALFEFTSLDGGGKSNAAGESASPLDVHSFVGEMPGGRTDEPLDWGNSLGFNTAPTAFSELERIEVGNLSALEEDRRASHPAIEDMPEIRIPNEAPLPSDDLLGHHDERKGGARGGVIAFLVLLFVLGGAGGAYFSGAVPPHIVQKLGLPAR
jgi:eukaryotic-like serine/threonine-protein kinase